MPNLNCSSVCQESVDSLAAAKISSMLDFIQADVDKIVLNSELDAETVLLLKHKFINEYSCMPVKGFELFTSVGENIKTNIKGLDTLLDGGLVNGSVIEFCGPASCGKTQLCHSIAVNVAANNMQVEYIDTKLDFSASRCNNLLPSNLQDKDMDRILENIRVHRPKNIYSLISTLESLKDKLNKSEISTKLIIIDSLIAHYLPLVGISSNKGLSLLSYIASSLKELAAKYKLSVVITNLGVRYFDEEDLKKKDPDEIKPLLGKFWTHVPNTRIIINRETPYIKNRSLIIQKSDSYSLKKLGEISITEKGVT